MKRENEEIDYGHRTFQYVNTPLRNEIVRGIDAVFSQLETSEKSRLQLRDEFEKFKANARDLANAELIEENKKLKAELELCYCGYMFDSKKEVEAFKAFEQKHIHNRKTRKIEGGKMPYIISYGHGLGCCKTAVCQICGETKDITDTSLW